MRASLRSVPTFQKPREQSKNEERVHWWAQACLSTDDSN